MISQIISVSNSIFAIVGAILGFIPTFVFLLKTIKQRKVAKTEAERAKADADMQAYATQLIKDAEASYAAFDVVLKQSGKSAGEVKKKSVLSDLQTYAISKDYKFDKDKWSEAIDTIVELTKQVNKK